jgi:hypothetical protein
MTDKCVMLDALKKERKIVGLCFEDADEAKEYLELFARIEWCRKGKSLDEFEGVGNCGGSAGAAAGAAAGEAAEAKRRHHHRRLLRK